VLSGRGLCVELITRPEESYRLWCVVVCDLETSRMRRPWPALGRSSVGKKGQFNYAERTKTKYLNSLEILSFADTNAGILAQNYIVMHNDFVHTYKC